MHMVLPEVPEQGSVGMLGPTPGGQWVSRDPGDASPRTLKDNMLCWALTECTHACSRTHLAVPFVLGPQNTPIYINLVRFTPARLSSGGSDPVKRCLPPDCPGTVLVPQVLLGTGLSQGCPFTSHMSQLLEEWGNGRRQLLAGSSICSPRLFLQMLLTRETKRRGEMRRAANSWMQPLALGLCFSLSLVLT